MKRVESMARPYLGGLFLLVGLPAVAAMALAFTRYSGLEDPRFVGGANFARLGRDNLFHLAAGNTAAFVAIATPLRLFAATTAAILLGRRGAAAGAGRALVFLPSVMPDAAYALLWLWVLNPVYGPAAALLGVFGQGLLTDPWGTRIAISVMSALQVGEAFIIALAVRRSIPASLYDAAAADGASPWYALRRVTLPLMAPALVLLALREVVLAFGTSFVPAFLVTGGGPRYATTFIPLYMYRQAFGYFRFGYAAAISVAIFVLTAGVVYAQYRLARRWRLL